MEIQVPHFQERRQFGRIKIPGPSLCQIYVPHSRKLIVYRGQIKNISLGGIYFICDEQPPLTRDNIRYLIFNIIYNYQKIYRLTFHGLVVRTEMVSSQFAIALQFLSDPVYYPIKTIDEELPYVDKIRIMYQNYDLYRKAYETVEETPEIRTDKINNIKNRLEHNLYQIDQTKLARAMTENLTDNYGNLAGESYQRIMK
jgi:hypothetical protein